MCLIGLLLLLLARTTLLLQVLQRAQLKRQMMRPGGGSSGAGGSAALDMLRCVRGVGPAAAVQTKKGLSPPQPLWQGLLSGRQVHSAGLCAVPLCLLSPCYYSCSWWRRREVDVMRSCNHPNLIKIFEVIDADSKVGGRAGGWVAGAAC